MKTSLTLAAVAAAALTPLAARAQVAELGYVTEEEIARRLTPDLPEPLVGVFTPRGYDSVRVEIAEAGADSFALYNVTRVFTDGDTLRVLGAEPDGDGESTYELALPIVSADTGTYAYRYVEAATSEDFSYASEATAEFRLDAGRIGMIVRADEWEVQRHEYEDGRLARILPLDTLGVPTGDTTAFRYDGEGRLLATEATITSPGEDLERYVTRYAYEDGRLTRVTSPNEGDSPADVTVVEYEGGEPVAVVDSLYGTAADDEAWIVTRTVRIDDGTRPGFVRLEQTVTEGDVVSVYRGAFYGVDATTSSLLRPAPAAAPVSFTLANPARAGAAVRVGGAADLSGVGLSLVGFDGRRAALSLDGESARLPLVAPGAYVLAAEAPGYAPATRVVVIAE